MTNLGWINPLRQDGMGVSLSGGSKISAILNVAVSATWSALQMPSSVSCKSLAARLRSGDPWRFRLVGETEYFTITESISLDLVLLSGEVIGEVQADGADTLEILMID